MTGQAAIIRLAAVDDAAAMAGIYRPYVEDAAMTFEITAPSEEEFARRIVHTLERYPWVVAECDGRVVGYVYAGPLKARRIRSQRGGFHLAATR